MKTVNEKETKSIGLSMDELAGVNGGNEDSVIQPMQVELPSLEIKGPEDLGNGVVSLDARNDPNGLKLFANTVQETMSTVKDVLYGALQVFHQLSGGNYT